MADILPGLIPRFSKQWTDWKLLKRTSPVHAYAIITVNFHIIKQAIGYIYQFVSSYELQCWGDCCVELLRCCFLLLLVCVQSSFFLRLP